MNEYTFMITVICGNKRFKYICDWDSEKSISELSAKAEEYHYKLMTEAEGYMPDADDKNVVTGIEIHRLEGEDIPEEFLNQL